VSTKLRMERFEARRRNTMIRRCPECGESYGPGTLFCGFDGATLVAGEASRSRDLLMGKVIDGRYEVVSLIGEGGMGTVYKVRHITLERMFAMKVLKRSLAQDDKLAERFIVEAKATASVKHPSVVEITDFGRLSDRRPYFVMELLVGQTLSELIHTIGFVEPMLLSAITAKVARALSAAHVAGIIHRDMKSENVVLIGRSPEPEVKVVDFGAALVVGAKRMTRAGVVFGTPHFMSPEQASGKSIDHRADIYSLGVVMYEALTGQVPFQGDAYIEVLRQHLFDAPRPPSKLISDPKRAAAARLVEPIILRSLAKEPAERYPTMDSLAVDLERLSRGMSIEPSSSRVWPVRKSRSSSSKRKGADPALVWKVAAAGVALALVLMLVLIRVASHSAALGPPRPSGSVVLEAVASPPAPPLVSGESVGSAASASASPRSAVSAGSTRPHPSGNSPRQRAQGDVFRDPWTK
jgi:serine/threonine protein kinase